MIQVFTNVKLDWLAKRRLFIGFSFNHLAGLGSAMFGNEPGGTEAFNLGRLKGDGGHHEITADYPEAFARRSPTWRA